LNTRLAEQLQKSPPKHFEPVASFSDFDKGEILVLACVIDTETVVFEKSGDGFVTLISVTAEALVIDFSTRSVVAAFPFLLTVNDYLDREPGDAELAERVRLCFFDAASQKTVIDQFVSAVNEMRPHSRIGATIQVRQLDIEERALKFLPAYYARQTDTLKLRLAQQFGSELASAHGVAMLPYTRDAAMGQMALRFNNAATVINLKIPEPSYCIDLTLNGFSKTIYKETASETAWLYGSYFKVRLYQQLLGRDFLNEEAKHGYSRVVPKAKQQMDDWTSFDLSMRGFCIEYAGKLGTDKKQREVKEALQKCRF
jgi:hypothetical protein